jgi:hypothetical protein
MGRTGMPLHTVALSLLAFAGFALAATPGGAPDTPLTTFRVESAEVHIAFSAVDKKHRPVTELSAADFTLLRDGHPLNQQVQVERRQDAPIIAVVMTDVSDSMIKALPMARNSWQWMNSNLLRNDDQISYFDFGAQLTHANEKQPSEGRLTSFNDCLLSAIPRVSQNPAGRRAIIMFTDGGDTASLHPLQDAINLAIEQDIAVYAIATWKFKIKYDDETLNYLTSSTGGRFFEVRDQKEMVAALQQIAQELRNGYEVVFRADKDRGGMHRITMQATDRHMRFFHRTAYFQPAKVAEPLLVASGR